MNTPHCIGFVTDGNRRWARENGLSTLKGHQRGLEKFKEVLDWLIELDIKNAVFYAFSTENWNRSGSEVTYLMDLFEGAFDIMKKIHEHKIRLRFIGQIDRLPNKLQRLIKKAEKGTKDYTNGVLAIALSYGGRAEIVRATNEIIKNKNGDSITEKDFSKHLWTTGIPDPDIIVRTGGAVRLSNFLPWQSIYSELCFINTYWPDFSKEELMDIIKDYGVRERRMGK